MAFDIDNYNPFSIPLESGKLSSFYDDAEVHWSQGTLEVQNTLLKAISEGGKASAFSFAVWKLATKADGSWRYRDEMTWKKFQDKLKTVSGDKSQTIDHRFFREYGLLILSGYEDKDGESAFGEDGEKKPSRFDREVAEQVKNSSPPKAA